MSGDSIRGVNTLTAAPVHFGPRRAVFVDVAEHMATLGTPPEAPVLEHLESLDAIFRGLCAAMFNYVPTSGHPGGSISSGRIVAALLFGTMDYDLARPERRDADVLCYAAGHKALGLYAMWALRNEIARIAAPDLLPADERRQLRLEDLLGFRRNPSAGTPLMTRFRAKPLDGHPTPATPFVRLATGASGVGLGAALGLAWAAADLYGDNAPRVHVLEGEGGMTPGRVSEALAAAGTASLDNIVLHVDWNQASIDSNRVCREDGAPGEYVQWTPEELVFLHDWNVVLVRDGFDLRQILAAQHAALSLANGQPTAIVYRTVKGWRYGIEGRASHGGGHPLCSDGYYQAMSLLPRAASLPKCFGGPTRCNGGKDAATVEECYWEALEIVRRAVEDRTSMVEVLAARLRSARDRLHIRSRRPRAGAPRIEEVYKMVGQGCAPPSELAFEPGTRVALRDALGLVLNHYNLVSGGAVVAAAADLLSSTSIAQAGRGFPPGFWHRRANPESRLLSIGGICEDAMAAMMSGIAAFGDHVGAGSSYAAFNAPLGHVAARLHAIGNQARVSVEGGAYRPFLLVCAHAGLQTGEDGPTHADPQALQLLQNNFPDGTMITLTPWDPREMWPLMSAAMAARPAIIAPFVTRPPETVVDRVALGLPPPALAAQGVYRLRKARGRRAGTVVLQGCGVTHAFVTVAMRLLEREGLELDVYVVTSAELFDRLPEAERARTFPEDRQLEAMAITDFTWPTATRWVRSDLGRAHTLHPFRGGHYLGSGTAAAVMAEAGLDGPSQFEAIRAYLRALSSSRSGDTATLPGRHP